MNKMKKELMIGALGLITTNLISGQEKPNLIFILADQLRHDVLGYAGDDIAITPNLDRLAGESVNLTNAVVCGPVSAAMRSSLFTGKYISSTGMVVNELRLNPNHRAIGHVLNENGYENGYIGKWHLYGNCSRHSDPECAYIPPGPHRLGFDGEWKAFNFWHKYHEAFYFEDTPEKIFYPEGAYEPEEQTKYALDFIEKSSSDRSKPFALFLSYGVPHDPWTKDNVPEKYYNMFRDVDFSLPETWNDTPDQYMDRFKDSTRWMDYYKPGIPEMKRVYYAMVTSMDEYIGRIMLKLEELGIDDNTILVFTSDHGEMFGEHGRVQKMIFYDAAARVPFLIRWPGMIPAGSESDITINTPDIMPTLLGLMNLSIPDEVEGSNLQRQVRGKWGPQPKMAFLQGMGHTYQWIDGSEWRAVRNKRYTYARYLVDGKELLFDNLNDPLQKENLADDPKYSRKLRKMKRYMSRKMNKLNDEFMPCSWYRDNWTDGNRVIIRAAQGDF
jgi:arylsulfatase A-like enzyme